MSVAAGSSSSSSSVSARSNKKKKVTKESVFNDTKARFEKEFPNVAIPDSTLRGYSMVYLLSGLREDAMTKMIEKEKERQKNEGGS